MSLKLFEHNQSAFISVIEMLSVTGKAAVIHPTGTGKTYIGFSLKCGIGGKACTKKQLNAFWM